MPSKPIAKLCLKICQRLINKSEYISTYVIRYNSGTSYSQLAGHLAAPLADGVNVGLVSSIWLSTAKLHSDVCSGQLLKPCMHDCANDPKTDCVKANQVGQCSDVNIHHDQSCQLKAIMCTFRRTKPQPINWANWTIEDTAGKSLDVIALESRALLGEI